MASEIDAIFKGKASLFSHNTSQIEHGDGWNHHGHTLWRKPAALKSMTDLPIQPRKSNNVRKRASKFDKETAGISKKCCQLPISSSELHLRHTGAPTAGASLKPARPSSASLEQTPVKMAQTARNAKPRARKGSGSSGSGGDSKLNVRREGVKSTDVGSESYHLLLVLGLPASCTVSQIQQHFRESAPLQVQMLTDWGTQQPRRAACVALTSNAAIRHATAVGEIGGAQICVCGAAGTAQAHKALSSSMSTAMREKLRTLEERIVKAIGVSPLPSSIAHVLRCSQYDVVSVAVEEALRTLASGKVKRPTQLFESHLLKRRKADSGAVWIRRVNGLPLPIAPTLRLRQLLEGLDWAKMPAEGKLRGIMADKSFKLGLSTKAWGRNNNGPYTPFAFKEDTGVWDAASIVHRHHELWEAASALIAAIDPAYHWTSVQFNRNFRGSLHRDDKDASYQVATAFGDYTGGELRVHGKDGIIDVNTRDRFVRFDGRFLHEVLPYEGTRYSVIYFQLEPPWSVDLTSTEEGT